MEESKLVLTYIQPDDRFLFEKPKEIIETGIGHYLVEKNFERGLNRGIVDTMIRAAAGCSNMRPKRIEVTYEE